MIVSVHLADLSPRDAIGAMRSVPDAATVAGLEWAELCTGARFTPSVVPSPTPGRLALVAAWADDAGLDAWLERVPLARRLARGWHVRLEPLRATTSELRTIPAFADGERAVDDDEPVAVLTYGRLRYRVAHHFLRASAKAEGRALADPAMLAGTALAAPPRTVGTFSLWRTAAEMKRYAYDAGSHTDAMRGMRIHDFHSEYAFVRFRPYGARGTWDGRDPLAAASAQRAAA